MSSLTEAKVPDIGNYHDVPVIELLVKPGDTVTKDQGLVTLESDKATMEVPASQAGTIKELKVKLGAADMQGGCMSISSLGGIGGTHFTPIINAPEVAILGLSRSAMKPVWDGQQFVPRLMLPLSLSYDHRVIDGASAARFNAYLGQVLADYRRILL